MASPSQRKIRLENSGVETLIATSIIGVIWVIVYHKTGSLRWIIVGHFLVNFLTVSSAAFLDLFEKQQF